MFGWLREEADFASSTKRRTRSSLLTSSGGRTLSATLRSFPTQRGVATR